MFISKPLNNKIYIAETNGKKITWSVMPAICTGPECVDVRINDLRRIPLSIRKQAA